MTKSELINRIAEARPNWPHGTVSEGVTSLIEQMTQALMSGERIEIRGFGSFTIRKRPPRMSRNPKTGQSFQLKERYAPYFRPGKALAERVNSAKNKA
ncbi:MAG: integration host factor subunit beta [Methylococcales bacterium]|jgi:integration host factor subunit beta|nr:integration host factor subunit beta [Methylococcales bacterium]MBT7444796.1 integration host factor subunit beta [Methylococcales bacterium]